MNKFSTASESPLNPFVVKILASIFISVKHSTVMSYLSISQNIIAGWVDENISMMSGFHFEYNGFTGMPKQSAAKMIADKYGSFSELIAMTCVEL